MKRNNTFKKWIALFLSVAMVAVSGVTTNTSMSAAESTGVQESAAADTTDGTAAADADASSAASSANEDDTSKTQEIALQDDGTTAGTTEDEETEPAKTTEPTVTDSTAASSTSSDSGVESTSSTSESSSDEVLSEDEQIDKAREDATKRTYSYDDANISVNAVLDDPKAIPDNAEFRVTLITQNTTGYNYNAYMDALNAAAASSDSDTEKKYTDENTLLYDMAFIYKIDVQNDDGTTSQKEVEVQPAEGAVKISVNFKKDQLTKSLDADKDSDIEIKHLPLTDAVKESTDTTAAATNISAADVKVEDVNADASADRNCVDFSCTNFSVFAVYSDPSIGTVKIDDINLQSVLGDGYDYGIVANKYHQDGDTETNVMVGEYSSTAAELGASSNYSNAGGNNYFGSFAENTRLRFHQPPANIYLGEDAWNQYISNSVTFDQAHIKGSNIEKKNIDVSRVITSINNNFAGYIPSKLPSEIDNLINGKNSNNQPCDLILDFTTLDAGTYLVNFNGTQISSNDASKNLNIKKNDDQTIVFYCTTSGELDINDYEVNGISMNTYVTNTSKEADNIIQQIIFYAPNATKLNITKETSGIFIAPIAEFSKSNTSGGVLVCDKYSGGTGEWHYHNHNLQAPAEAGYKLKAKKNFEGGTLNGNDFSFSLYNADENFKIKESPIQTKPNDSSGDIQFDNITYNQEGINYYVLKENNTEKPNVKYDSTEYHITVEVKLDTASNKYVVNSSSITDVKGNAIVIPVFNNSYNTKSASVTLGGHKYVDGTEQSDEPFTFTLSENGKVIDTVERTGAGDYHFSPITYEKAGEHVYKVAETKGNAAGYTYDDKTYTVNVNVVADENGQLKAEISGDAKTGTDLDFTNTYKADGTSVTFSGTKTLNGRSLKNDEFAFDLKDADGKILQTVKNDKDGKIVFGEIKYAKAGTYTYTISEESTQKAGVTIDDKVYDVKVTVTDDGSGQLKASVEGLNADGSGADFTNSFNAKSASVSLGGLKTVEGIENSDKAFSFTLSEGDTILQTVTRAGAGEYRFESLTYDKAGEHTYTVAEKKGTAEGYTYDDKIYTVKVNVTDDGNGQLKAEISGDTKTGTDLNFTNTYEAKAASAVISGTKTLNGVPASVAGQFRFDLFDANGKRIDTAANDEKGNFIFGRLHFEKAGVYTYTIKEQNAGEIIDGIRYQNAARTVTITVKDDGNGHLVANNATAAAFDNEKYGTITVGKNWNDAGNEKYRPSTVVVDLIDAATGETVQKAELSEVNNWTATFDQLVPGGRYTVHEDENSEYYAAENNDQVVTADANGTQVTLVNDFVQPAVTIYANKVLNGGTLANGEFTFNLYRNSDPDTVVKTATNNASGEIFFTDIAYDAKGYTVREAAGDDGSIAYDSEAIVYDAKGNITSDHREFTNTQRPIVLRVQKRSKEAPYDPLVGATYGLYQVVEGGNDILVESEISDENGYMYYGRIQPGVIYYFKEIAAPEGHEVDPYPGQKFQVKYTGNGQIALYDENGNPTTVGDITGQDSKNLLVQYTTEKTAVDTSSSLSYSDDSIVAVAKADNSKAFAAGTKLKVTQLSGSDAKAAAAAVEAACGKIDSNIAYYDIQFIDASGNEVEPAGGDVTVTIQYKGSLDLPEGTDRTALKLVHLTKEANGETTVEAVPGTVAADQDGLLQTSFTADSFSTFGVVEPGSDNTLGQNYLVTAAGVADQVSELKVAKLDTAGKYIKGAKLQIIEKATGNVVAEWTTSDGPQSFARWFDDAKTVPMNVDTYYILHEVSAPDGYQLADDILFMINKYDSSITVYKYDENGKLVIDQEAIDKWVSDTTLQMIDVPVKHETVTLVKQKLVPNEKTIQGEDKIVHVTSIQAVRTGDTTPIALFVILLAAAAVVLLILVYRGRKKKDS